MPPIWFKWMKFEVMEWIWSLSLKTFSMGFSSVLRKTIDWNVLEKLYKGLLDFEIITDIDFLK